MSNSPVPPDLEAVAEIDYDYQTDLRTMELWIKFHKDYLKRPAQLQ